MKNMKYIIVFNNQHACTQIKITLTRLSCMITWSMITMSMVFHLRCCICIICWAGIVHPMSTLEYSTGGNLWIYGTIYILFQTWIKENTRDFLFHIEVFSSFLTYGTTKFFCIFILLYKNYQILLTFGWFYPSSFFGSKCRDIWKFSLISRFDYNMFVIM